MTRLYTHFGKYFNALVWELLIMAPNMVDCIIFLGLVSRLAVTLITLGGVNL